MVTVLETEVCVVGGGPGGRALALALTRLGRRVVLLEKRDPARGNGPAFRGESVSPDGVRLLAGLGVLGRLRGATHRVDRLELTDAGRKVLDVRFADFPYTYRHPVELAQPALLSALAAPVSAPGSGCAVLEPATVTGLLTEGAAVTGVRAGTAEGAVEVRAALTVGADGRHSAVRRLSGLEAGVRRTPLERDVVWLKLPFPAAWDRRTYRVRISGGSHGLFLPSTDGTVRVGLNIPKGGLRALRSAGLDALRARLAELAPEAAEAARDGLTSWSDTVLLDIFTAEVPRWSAPGVVLIGDAAHTLSPILGQGVNHALADAVALAPLAARELAAADRCRCAGTWRPLAGALETFQRRREGDIRRSRALQMRQERMFTLTAPAATVVRRTVYRAVSASPALRRRVLAPAYFPGQRPLPAGSRTPERAPDAPDTPGPSGSPDTSGSPDPQGSSGSSGSPDTQGSSDPQGSPGSSGFPDPQGSPDSSGSPDPQGSPGSPSPSGSPDPARPPGPPRPPDPPDPPGPPGVPKEDETV